MEKESLENEIKKHNKLYWIEGNPEISDPDYDKLVEELREIDPTNPLIYEIHSPKVSSTGKVKHIFPMLSLNKVYTKEDLIKWCEKVARNKDEEFLFQLKYDGCSAELSNKILSTKGNEEDGMYGENITNKLPIIMIDLPSQSKRVYGPNFEGYVRGEILIMKQTFENIKNTKSNYKTPRNMCAGILNRDTIDISLGAILTLVDFNLFSLIYSLEEIKTALNFDHLINKFKNSKYPADGIVVKLKDQEYGKSLGVTSHHSKSEMALKFANPTGETILTGVEFSSGKNKLTPIGKVEPIEISGVIISNVNLHNYKYILDKEIYIGDTIIVERAGDVIPDIQSSNPTEGIPRISICLKKCPDCNHDIKYIEPELVCTNENCPGKHLAQLIDSIRRIGIERLGEPTLKKIINNFKIINLLDIFKLTKNDILQLDGFASTSASNLINEINLVKENGVFEWQILSCLNLNGIGTTLSRDLLKNRSLNELMEMNYNDFIEIDGIGPERSKILVDGLKWNLHYISELLKILPIKKEKSINNLTGVIFALTGKMPLERKEITKLIEDEGGEVKGISKNTNYLICDNLDSKSTKMKKAFEYGITIITFDQLMKMLKQKL